jgi:hypothetical protein
LRNSPAASYGMKRMNLIKQARAILTDAHFLISIAVFCIGLALLITLH